MLPLNLFLNYVLKDLQIKAMKYKLLSKAIKIYNTYEIP